MPEWGVSQLRELVSFQKGRKVRTSSESLTKFDIYLGAGALSGGHDGYAEAATGVRAEPRDILMLWDGERSGFVGTGLCGVVSSTVARLSPNPCIDSSFLFHALTAKFEWIQNQRTGSGVPHVPKDVGRKLLIEFPVDKREQQRIALVLSTLDEAATQTEALIAKTQQVKAGMMHDLFTRGVTPDGRLRPTRAEAPRLYKESTLGWIPKDWECMLLDEIAQRGSGHTPNKGEPSFWNGSIKWVSLADSSRLDRVYISETDKRITAAGIANSSAVLHPAGVVVLSRDAGVGKSAITTEAMAVSQHFMCWKCSHRLNNHFLYYWLQTEKHRFENIATGTTIPTIGLLFFRRYRISVPASVKEQEKIATALLTLDQRLFLLEEEEGKLRALKHGLMHDLLAGRVRVSVPAQSSE